MIARSKVSLWLALMVLLLFGVGGPLQADPAGRLDRPERALPAGVDPPPWREGGGAEPAPEVAPAMPEMVPWSKLVFYAYRDSNWEIYRANADGSGQTRLTYDGAIDIHPDLKPGCTRIAFASKRDGDYEIYTMNLDGGGLSQLTYNSTDDVNPDWSSDGSKIAFEAYRDGKAEIYVMNADGSGQTRLTNAAVYAGEPDWSPDGARIAYTNFNWAVNSYEIIVMNANGSGQVRRSNQAYSEHPFWSPDGLQIAYDSDGDGDGWQELWLMNADGTNQREVREPGGTNTDAWAGGWSADGRYVAFAKISWVNYGGNWYWTTSYLDAWNVQTGSVTRLSNDGRDWAPSWASCDVTAPNTRVNPLPAESIWQFTVSWSGSDSGGSGLVDYDVQVREGSGGAWTDWRTATTATSASYTGVGGTTYYFRSRGRDGAGHVEVWPGGPDAWTRVESEPPTSYVEPLPAYSTTPLTVTWQGTDPGGSGIAHYDVQYKDLTAQGGWVDWQHLTPAATALFTGTAGHTFAFRSSATDRASNTEPWPAGGGDAWTTLYSWKVEGAAMDNAGTPLAGVVITTAPEAFASSASNAAGGYYAYVADRSSTYTATWSKAGYGMLPATPLEGAADAHVDLLLPPADNAVQNGGFESGSLSPGWQAAGSPIPTVVTDERHTGLSAARLGSGGIRGLPEVTQIDQGMLEPTHQVVSHVDGTTHLVWSNWSDWGSLDDVFYVRREANGTWLATERVTGAASSDWNPRVAIDAAGRAHVVWLGYGIGNIDVVYGRRSTDGTWSNPQPAASVLDPEFAADPQVAVDALGQVHVTWSQEDAMANRVLNHRVLYTDDTWSAQQTISPLAGCPDDQRQIALDEGGFVHLVWVNEEDIYYAMWDPVGTWSTPENLSNSASIWSSEWPQIVVDGAGTLHVFWTFCMTELIHASRPAGGVWSTEVVAVTLDGAFPLVVAVDPGDLLHLLWVGDGPEYPTLVYASGLTGDWSTPQQVSGSHSAGISAGALDSAGRMHAAWMEASQLDWEIFYSAQTDSDTWSEPIRISDTPDSLSYDPSVAVDLSLVPQVVWLEKVESVYSLNRAEWASLTASDPVLSQTVSLSSSLQSPALAFAYRLEGASAASGTWFGVEVQDGLTRTVVLSTAQNTADWTWQRFDLSSQVGPTVTLTFRVHEVAGEPYARVYLDEVSVGSAYPDLWLSDCTRAALPGETFHCRLVYGDQSAVGASGARITHTLPAGLHLVGASPPPITTTPALVWELGDLAGRSGPELLVITATVAPTATLWTTLAGPIEIRSTTAELEGWNNTTTLSVFVGQRAYLPLMLKR